MKEEFTNGKWYKHNPYNDLRNLWYIKYSRTYASILASEFIDDDGNHYKKQGKFSNSPEQYRLINISEIAHLLPKGHPDLQNIERNYELW